jgi:hypothetical protein
MLKTVDFYFGKKKVKDFLKIPTEKSKRVFFYAAEDGGGRLCESLARQVVDIAKDALIDQSYNPKPLNEKYAAWKTKRGFPADPGLMTFMMLQNLSFFRTGDRKGWVVGYKEATHGLFGMEMFNEITKTALIEYATWYEFGAVRKKSTQVARPFMRYSLDKMMRTNFKQTVVKEFIKPFEDVWWSEEMRWKF